MKSGTALPNIIIYQGPMWSGKTTALRMHYDLAKAAGLTAITLNCPHNTRNSVRDIVDTVGGNPPYDVVILDEIHLYNYNEVKKVVKDYPAKTYVMAGLEHDFYMNGEEFSIWEQILRNLKYESVSLRKTYSYAPCSKCKGLFGVKHSVSTDFSKDKVGDHYTNVCSKCASEIYVQYEQQKRPSK